MHATSFARFVSRIQIHWWLANSWLNGLGQREWRPILDQMQPLLAERRTGFVGFIGCVRYEADRLFVFLPSSLHVNTVSVVIMITVTMGLSVNGGIM